MAINIKPLKKTSCIFVIDVRRKNLKALSNIINAQNTVMTDFKWPDTDQLMIYNFHDAKY